MSELSEKETFTIEVSKRPWYEWLLWGIWLFAEIFLLQNAIASGGEIEPRAATIFWVSFVVLLIGGGVATLRRLGFHYVLVEAGGDLAARGRRSDGALWRVGVTHPRRTGSPLTALSMTGRAAATSGDYAHTFRADYSQHHILDPRRGCSPAQLASVTVLAPTATDADALSTAAMVLGTDAGLPLLERLPHVEGLFVTKEMTALHTTGLPAGT